MVQRGLEVEAALRRTFRRLALDRCGPQVAAHDREQFGLHGRGDGHELLPGDADEFAVVVVESGDVHALEVEGLGDAVLDHVADPVVDARADPLEPTLLRGIGKSVSAEFLHAGGGDGALAGGGSTVADHPGGGWVRNGDRWTVTRVHNDGSMQVQRLGLAVGGSVTLPAAYVAEHVDLGYAVTAHRAQGMTVDTSHVVVTGSTTRENFYVSMTRGRDSNIAYVALDKPDEGHAPPEPDEVNAHTVLYGVLQHIGGELSALQMIAAEQDRWASLAQLAAEYETIGAVAQRDRWVAAIRRSGLTDAEVEQVLASESFGPLTAELRRAEANHHDVDRLLPALVARRSLDDAEDIGAVLISRLQKAAQSKRGSRRPSRRLVVGLIPVADGPMSEKMARALTERADLMEARAMTLAEKAAEDKAAWLKRLGTVPATAGARRRWLHEVRTVAAYRDRYGVEGPRVLGEPRTDAQKLDAARAEQAIRRARAIADDAASAQEGRSQALESHGRTALGG